MGAVGNRRRSAGAGGLSRQRGRVPLARPVRWLGSDARRLGALVATVLAVAASIGASGAQASGPGATISTVAGTGAAAYSGDGGPATSAALDFTLGVAADGAGGLFIADGV